MAEVTIKTRLYPLGYEEPLVDNINDEVFNQIPKPRTIFQIRGEIIEGEPTKDYVITQSEDLSQTFIKPIYTQDLTDIADNLFTANEFKTVSIPFKAATEVDS